MLKLKDIFNIDYSSKGGAKLYKKIMRKYNIPLKDVKEVKQEIAECSSGNNELLYYYKWKDGADKFDELFDLIGQMCRVKNIINGGRLLYNIVYAYDNKDFNNKELMRNSDAFCMFGEQTPIMAGDNNNYLIISKGNLIDKINGLNVLYPSEDASQIIPLVIAYVNNNLTEITKEEYESLITQ